jgi:hypothetical protein
LTPSIIYDKEKHKFNNRDKGTVAPFADLDREALAYVIDVIVKKVKDEKDILFLKVLW